MKKMIGAVLLMTVIIQAAWFVPMVHKVQADVVQGHTIYGEVYPLITNYLNNPENDNLKTELNNYFSKASVNLYDDNLNGLFSNTMTDTPIYSDYLKGYYGSFRLDNIPNGTYIMALGRRGMCTKYINICVAGADVDVGTKMLIGADVDNDGKITALDAGVIYNLYSVGNCTVGSEYYNPDADVNGDGVISNADYSLTSEAINAFNGYQYDGFISPCSTGPTWTINGMPVSSPYMNIPVNFNCNLSSATITINNSFCNPLDPVTVNTSTVYMRSGGSFYYIKSIDLFSNCKTFTIVLNRTIIPTLSFIYLDGIKDTMGFNMPSTCIYLIPVSSPFTPVQSITLLQNTASLKIGQSVNLSPLVLPANASNSVLCWSSDNPAVAEVKNGVVTAKAAGNAVITAKATDGSGKYKPCAVTVSASSVSYTQERDILRKIGLSEITYDHAFIEKNCWKNDNKPVGFFNASYEPMFSKDDGVSWKEFCDQYVVNHTVINVANDGNMQAIAFKDENGEVIIAYRGTSSFGDFWNGAQYTILDEMSSQYQSALNFYDYVNLLHNPQKKKISLAGHSLGGALAAYVAIMRGEVASADCFNDATGWILWNTYIDNAKTIEKFTGIDTTKYTSFINTSIDAINGYVAGTDKDKRNRFEFASNGYSGNNGGVHGLAAILQYSNNNFWLTGNISNGSLVNKIICNSVTVLDGRPNLVLGTSGDDTIKYLIQADTLKPVIQEMKPNYIYTGNGNDTVYGGALNDTIVASGTKTKTLNGGLGSDTYIIDVSQIDSMIYIDDVWGYDVVYLKGITGLYDYPIVDSGDYAVMQFGGGKGIAVNKARSSAIAKVQLQDEHNNTRTFATAQGLMASRLYGAGNNAITPKFLRLTGLVDVSVYDASGTLLGTYDNNGNNVQTADYAYFYPTNSETEKSMGIDLTNGNYTLKITSGGMVGLQVYDPDASGSVYYEEQGIDLTGGGTLVVNSDFLNAENKFAIEKNNVTNPLAPVESVRTQQVSIDKSSISLTAGLNASANATVSPSNIISKDIAWTVIQPDESTVVATVNTNDDNSAIVTGISAGTDTLRATATDGSGVYAEIPVSVTQATAPNVTATADGVSYASETFTSADTVTLSSSVPSGFDTLYFSVNGNVSSVNSVDVTSEGETDIAVTAVNSTTGERTATACFTVKIDRTPPEISGVEQSQAYYIDRAVKVRDFFVEGVTVNDSVSFTQDELDNGKWLTQSGSYSLIASDQSGKTSSVDFTMLPLPDIATLTQDGLPTIQGIRTEFEEQKYSLPDDRRVYFEAKISALETKMTDLLSGTKFTFGISDIAVNNGNITVNIVNYNGAATNMPVMFVGVYDTQNRLINVFKRDITAGTDYYSVATAIPDSTANVRVYLWNSTDDMKPVAMVKECQK